MKKLVFAAVLCAALSLFILPVSAVQQTAPLIDSVCLVADGFTLDGTFSGYAEAGMMRAANDFDLDIRTIESSYNAFARDVQTCIREGFDVVITIGFMASDVTYAAAQANPTVYFIGVDQAVENPLPNYVGIQFREDQAGFLVGVMAALMTENASIGGIYGMEIPPVVRFRNGFEQGARYVNPDIEIQGVYVNDFMSPSRGEITAQQMIDNGVDVIFGAGGLTGSAGIYFAAGQGTMVIGVDQDEYFTTFEGGTALGAEHIITSAVKRIDNGVYQMIELLANGAGFNFDTGMYVLEVANEGIGYAPAHDSDVPEAVTSQVDEILAGLVDGSIETGVDPLTGELLTPMEASRTA